MTTQKWKLVPVEPTPEMTDAWNNDDSDELACRRIEQAYAQPRLFEDAKVGAGDTAVQGDMLLPANDGFTAGNNGER